MVALVLFVAGCPKTADVPREATFTGPTMGTTYSVKLATTLGEDERASLDVDIQDVLDTINQQMSTYIADSELSQFNQHSGTDWFPVSPEVVQVVVAASHVSEWSDGAFDVTVSPLVNLWGFGPGASRDRIPTGDEIAQALPAVGYTKVESRESPPALRKSHAEIMVDLSAIAKGFAVDQIAELLDRLGITSYLVEIGGELRARGAKTDGSDWKVGIETPHDSRRTLHRAVSLRDRAMATSGDYRNYFEQAGQRFSHTIDPRTGRPVEHRLASVTVIAETCMNADAMATALMVLGPDEGYNRAVQDELAVLMLVRDGQQFVEKASPAFDSLIEPEEAANVKIFVAAVLAFGIAMIGLAAGVIVSNRKLRGSCGGLNSLKDDQGRPMCEMCDTPTEDCTVVGKNPTAGTTNKI